MPRRGQDSPAVDSRGDHRARPHTPADFQRPQGIKQHWDPANIFRINANLAPVRSPGEGGADDRRPN